MRSRSRGDDEVKCAVCGRSFSREVKLTRSDFINVPTGIEGAKRVLQKAGGNIKGGIRAANSVAVTFSLEEMTDAIFKGDKAAAAKAFGALGFGGASAFIGGVVGGPFGALAGGIAGGIAGGFAGQAVGDATGSRTLCPDCFEKAASYYNQPEDRDALPDREGMSNGMGMAGGGAMAMRPM